MSIRSRAVEGVLFGLIATLGSATLAWGIHPEAVCLKAKFTARAKDEACFEKATLRHHYGNTTDFERDYTAYGKCSRRYLATWARLQIKNAGSGTVPCDGPRFTDNGDGTVTDRMTEFQWEQKTPEDSVANPGDPHDADNTYTLAAGPEPTLSDGTAFTSFLPALNNACFAGHCDWRLPTINELRTLFLDGYPCQTVPCVDPVFGAQSGATWSGTDELGHSFAWQADFNGAYVATRGRTAADHVRAVRGGPGS